MKRKQKKLINAKKYKIEHPKESLTAVAKKFNTDRHLLSKILQDDTDYFIDGHDEYMYYFTEDEMDMINFFIDNPTVSMREILSQYGNPCKAETLKHWITIVNGSYTTHTKYNNNKNAFNEIKTEEDAYWLGFITADGYVCETQPKIVLTLGEIDYTHLEKFAKYMGYTPEEIAVLIKKRYGRAYTHDNVVYSLTVCGKQIVQNLVDKNVVQGKSGKEVPYICSSKKLQKAYIRGLIDGDGYIGSTEFRMGLVGSLKITNFVRDFIDNELNWNDKSSHIYKHGKIYKYEISGRLKTTQILHLLYDDASIFLDRKYNLYKTYVAVEKSRN